MVARLAPEDRDVVVRQERRDGRIVYVLHTAAGPDFCVLRASNTARWNSGRSTKFSKENPFDQAEHTEHKARLRKHLDDVGSRRRSS